MSTPASDWISRAELHRRCRDLNMRPKVLARILRLNPDGFAPGRPPRGIHRHHDGRIEARLVMGCIGKGDFIRQHGRAAWESVPSFYKTKRGRREFVRRDAAADRVWEAQAQ